jgi:hypothetical protein
MEKELDGTETTYVYLEYSLRPQIETKESNSSKSSNKEMPLSPVSHVIVSST